MFRGQDAWRFHPLLKHTIADSFMPGLRPAVAAFATYVAFDQITGSSSSHGHGGGHGAHGANHVWYKAAPGAVPSRGKPEEEDDDDDDDDE